MPPPDYTGVQAVTGPQLPTIGELTAAMAGRIPSEHPARVVLLIAFLLASVDDWIRPETVTTKQGDTGHELLWALGVYDISALVRAQLIDSIGRVTHRADIGSAVDAVARAWRRHQRAPLDHATVGDEARHRQATGDLIEARANYTRLCSRVDYAHRFPTPQSHPISL